MILDLTPAARLRLASLLGETPDSAVRVAVRGGGCSGFQYDFSIMPRSAREDGDMMWTSDDIEHDWAVVIDPISAPYLEGSVLDYQESLTESKFVFKNPNAKAQCGCGQSFAA